jgi:hypothetical protein
VAALAVVAVAAAAACDDEEQAGPAPRTSSTATTLPPTTTASALELVDPNRGFSTDDFAVQRQLPEDGVTTGLTGARLGAASGYDRVTLEFEALPSNLDVGYVEESYSASNDGCAVEGLPAGPKLAARFYISGTRTGPAEDPASKPTYTGPDRLASPDTKSIVEARIVCEFEGGLEWVLTLREQRPFRIDVLDNPARFVIDVQTG